MTSAISLGSLHGLLSKLLKGGLYRGHIGIGVIKGDTKSLDNGLHGPTNSKHLGFKASGFKHAPLSDGRRGGLLYRPYMS